MINKIYVDYCTHQELEELNRNQNFRQQIKLSEEDNVEYIIGIDIAKPNSKDYSVMYRCIKNEDGSLTFKDFITL